VCAAMAMAEKKLNFEHRDLHWGNILCQKTETKYLEIAYTENATLKINCFGINVTIIDFSLSSIKTPCFDIGTDLADEVSFFEGEGDYQFEIYRKMKKLLNNTWIKNHNFETNVFWLDYLIEKLIIKLEDNDQVSISEDGSKEYFKDWKEYILYSKSCYEIIDKYFIQIINE
ncbi:MAG: Serine/threonine-protein kinase haspin, partial [Paramarteilia canceri]